TDGVPPRCTFFPYTTLFRSDDRPVVPAYPPPRPHEGVGGRRSERMLALVKLTNRHVGSPGAPDRSGEVGDGHADRVAPLGPGAVVLSHFVAEDLREHKTRVAAPLADPAVDDDGPAAVDADGGVELPQML